ncbi:hypothetical protein DL764_005394 [Monosporascus ibericus]|uniref:Rhodopsin domain-containing protein n=1 Tax=Monosporascus ibericus TaxID=155417 RepID=A0A4Q4T961_9PEZI|nr:hypothetical protein DL764_005394 [Monosporascus ibericus]
MYTTQSFRDRLPDLYPPARELGLAGFSVSAFLPPSSSGDAVIVHSPYHSSRVGHEMQVTADDSMCEPAKSPPALTRIRYGSASSKTTEWLFLGIALVLIVARLYLRLKIQYQRLAPSDCFLMTAWVASMSNACFDIAFLRLGVLTPEMDVTLSLVDDLEVLQQALRNFWATNFPFYTTLYMSKASILAFYRQLFPVGSRLYLLYQVQMERLVKLSVYCTFGLGIINLAVCLTRLLSVELTSADGLSLTLVSLWFLLDGNIGVIIACLPSLRPYIRLIYNRPYYPQLSMCRHGVISRGNVPLTTATTGNFGRIEDAPKERGNYVCTKVSQSPRPAPPSDDRQSLAGYNASTCTSSRSSAKGDARGSDIELVHVNGLESSLC